MASGTLPCCHLAAVGLIPFHIARLYCLHVQPEEVNHSLALFLVSSCLQRTAYVVRLVLRFRPSPADNIQSLGARMSTTLVGFHSGKSPLSGSPTRESVAQRTCKYASKSCAFSSSLARSESSVRYDTSSFVPVRSS